MLDRLMQVQTQGQGPGERDAWFTFDDNLDIMEVSQEPHNVRMGEHDGREMNRIGKLAKIQLWIGGIKLLVWMD